jgi:putative colanic acid biosynthesis UDP-glucose lipid carrier transferase
MKNSYKLSEANLVMNEANSLSVFAIILAVFSKIKGFFADLVNYLTSLVLQPRKIVVVGANQKGIALANLINAKRALGYKFLGFFDENANNELFKVKGNIEDLKNYCLNEKIDEIYFTMPNANYDVVADLVKFAEDNFIYIQIAADTKLVSQEVSLSYYNEIPVMSIQKHPLLSRANRIVKRAFDIVFSLCVLAILVPFVFPIIALAIKLESKGPIFFVQKRPGFKNGLFGCIKFRSMRTNIVSEKQATKNDARITKVGAFLRKTSLDELPQFINVLMGDMSIVGPRPNMVSQLETYSKLIDNYSTRHFVKPGITGLAQVNGFRGETQTLDLMEKRVEYDLKYIQGWNFFGDLKIVFLTVYNIVKGEENAY